jgi:hypothetical protein
MRGKPKEKPVPPLSPKDSEPPAHVTPELKPGDAVMLRAGPHLSAWSGPTHGLVVVDRDATWATVRWFDVHSGGYKSARIPVEHLAHHSPASNLAASVSRR